MRQTWTNGVIVDGQAVSQVELGETALIELSRGNVLRWDRVVEKEAIQKQEIPINWQLN